MSEKPRPSYYAHIPAFVRYSKIEPNAKLLYGEITALCEIEGYCWATNEYFAELYCVKIRMVQYWLRSLKELGAIKIDNPSNLDKDQQRKIWICDDAKKMFTERKKLQGGVQKIASTTLSINTTTNKNTPIIPKGDAQIPSKKRVKKSEELIKRGENIWTTDSQHKNLLKNANQDHSLVKCWYDRLERWKLEKCVEGGFDFKAINNWVIKAVEEERIRNNGKIAFNEKMIKRKEWAKQNEWCAPAGSAVADEEAYIIITGNKQIVYKYKDELDFWTQKGL